MWIEDCATVMCKENVKKAESIHLHIWSGSFFPVHTKTKVINPIHPTVSSNITDIIQMSVVALVLGGLRSDDIKHRTW